MNSPPTSGSDLLTRALRRRLRLLLPGVASLSVWQVCEALVPVAIGVVVDIAIIPLSVPMLIASIAGIAALFVVLSFGYRFGARLCNAAREREAHDLRVEVAHAALTSPDLPPDRASGEVLSIASADADLAAEVFGHVGRGAASVLGMIVAAVVLIVADPVTGLIVLIAVPVGLIVVSLPSRAVSAKAGAQLAATARAAQSASDLMRGLRVLKALGGAEWARRRFRIVSDEAAEAGVATGERSGRLSGLGALVMSTVLAVVLVVAGLRLIEGQLSVGALIAVLGMTAFLTEPMRALADIVGLAARSHGASVRIAELLIALSSQNAADSSQGADTPSAGSSSSTQQAGSQRNEARPAAPAQAEAAPFPASDPSSASGPSSASEPVDVMVDDRSMTVRGPVCADVPAGSFICFVAQDDRLAHGLLSALAISARTLGPEHVLVVPHAVDLFEGTIRTNITMTSVADTGPASPAASASTASADLSTDPPLTPPTDPPTSPRVPSPAGSDGAVSRDVLAASGADELLGLVEGGLDHGIEELGGNLSGGQRQRIALARALRADPGILVLEEPTTAVDAVTEARIADGVVRLRHGTAAGDDVPADDRLGEGPGAVDCGAAVRTTVVVTSSPAFLAVADQVVFAGSDGRTVTGTHADLLAADGATGDAYRTAVTR